MKRQPLWKIGAIVIAALVLIIGCGDDNSTPTPVGTNTVTISGTVNHPSWAVGDFLFAVFPQGVPPGPTGDIGGGFAFGGAGNVPYLSIVTENSGNAYVYSFNDMDGSGDPNGPGPEWFGCSGILTIGTADITAVNIVLEDPTAPPAACPPP